MLNYTVLDHKQLSYVYNVLIFYYLLKRADVKTRK